MDNEIVNLMAWFKEMFISEEVAEYIVAGAGGTLEEAQADVEAFNEENAEDIENEEVDEMREPDGEDVADWIRQGWGEYWFDMIDQWVVEKWAAGQLFYLDEESTTPVMLMIANPESVRSHHPDRPTGGCKWQVAGNPQWLTTWELLESMGDPAEDWWDEELEHPRNKHWVGCYREMGVI
jgi:hypothetical protein